MRLLDSVQLRPCVPVQARRGLLAGVQVHALTVLRVIRAVYRAARMLKCDPGTRI